MVFKFKFKMEKDSNLKKKEEQSIKFRKSNQTIKKNRINSFLIHFSLKEQYYHYSTGYPITSPYRRGRR